MTKPKDGCNVNDDNYIPVNEDKHREEHKIELEKATEAYMRECLKSFSATRVEKSLRNSIPQPHEVVGRPGRRPPTLWAQLTSPLSCGLSSGPTCHWHVE